MQLSHILHTLAASLMACSLMACGGSEGNDGPDVEFGIVRTSLTFTAEGGTQTVAVTTPAALRLTADATWLSASATEPTASLGVSTVTVEVQPNASLRERTATLTVASGSQSGTIDVRQAGVESHLSAASASVTFTADGGTQTVALVSPVAVSASSSATWATATVAGPDDNGAATLTLAVEPNATAARRSATITLTAGTERLELSVVQEASAVVTPSDAYLAKTIAPLMVPGWNLGNTLEATGTGLAAETSWQHTKTTQALLNYVRDLGFRSVRIPCSWDIHSDASGKIDAQWMARVREVVGYCVNAGLYVVINDHWDAGWIEVLGFSKSSTSYQAVDEATIAAKEARLKDLWTQIATGLADFDDHVLFAGLNEPFQQYDLFSSRHQALTPILARYNQAFVDAVRATGGNNAQRTLVVQGPSTSIESTYNYYTMPTDPAGEGRLMLEVHYYEPWDFSGQEDSSAKWFWGTANHVSGSSHNCTWGEESWTTTQMERLRSKYTSHGYPVIIGECGANWRKLSANQAEHDASIRAWFRDLNRKATSAGVVTFVWDINSTNQNGTKGTLTLIDRSALSIFCQPAYDGIMEGAAAGSWPY